MIQAIETRYKGYRFRSRLEARWAVFFDAIGVPWRYELQGVVLQGATLFDNAETECYLPDFLVGFHGAGHTWVETKPYIFDDGGLTAATKRTLKVMTELCYMPLEELDIGSFAGFVVGGDPSAYQVGVLAIPLFHDGTAGKKGDAVLGQVQGCLARIGICPCCGKFGFFVTGTKDDTRFQVLCGCIDESQHHVFVKQHQAKQFLEAPLIVDASNAARSARFEHRETPRVPRGKPRG